MREIYDYVERAFSSTPDSPKKFEMMQEVADRLIDSANRYIGEGKEQEDAMNKAIVEFGDLSEIRQEMFGGNEDIDLDEAYRKHKKALNRMWFSICASGLIILFFLSTNVLYSQGAIWWIYPAFGIIWWPLSLFFFGSWRKGGR